MTRRRRRGVFSPRAALRILSSPLIASPRLCVRVAVGFSGFSLVIGLPSFISAAGLGPALFDALIGTMPMSDCPAAFASGLRPQAFPARPVGGESTGTSGLSRGFSAAFSCAGCPRMLSVFDLAGPGGGSRFIARRTAAHAQRLRLRGAGRRLAIYRTPDGRACSGSSTPRGRAAARDLSPPPVWPSP